MNPNYINTAQLVYPTASTPIGHPALLSNVIPMLPPPPFCFAASELPQEVLSPVVSSTAQKKAAAKKKRNGVNLKERRRNTLINEAFLHLQKLIPFAPGEQKLPKIKTLRLATSYIGYLTQILEEDNKCSDRHSSSCSTGDRSSNCVSDFSRIVAAEVQAKNTYKERADELIQASKRQRLETESAFVPLRSPHIWPQCSCCPF